MGKQNAGIIAHAMGLAEAERTVKARQYAEDQQAKRLACNRCARVLRRCLGLATVAEQSDTGRRDVLFIVNGHLFLVGFFSATHAQILPPPVARTDSHAWLSVSPDMRGIDKILTPLLVAAYRARPGTSVVPPTFTRKRPASQPSKGAKGLPPHGQERRPDGHATR